MNRLFLNCILFAQQNPLDNFAREFQGRESRLDSGYLVTGLVVLVGMVLAVCLLAQLLERYGGRRPVDNTDFVGRSGGSCGGWREISN
jgi:hypothetical protein